MYTALQKCTPFKTPTILQKLTPFKPPAVAYMAEIDPYGNSTEIDFFQDPSKREKGQ